MMKGFLSMYRPIILAFGNSVSNNYRNVQKRRNQKGRNFLDKKDEKNLAEILAFLYAFIHISQSQFLIIFGS